MTRAFGRSGLVAVLISIVVAAYGCGSTAPSPSASLSPAPTAAVTPTPTPSPTPTPRFVATGSMAARRSQFTATRLLDGRVLVVGGLDHVAKKALASAEIYDPATGLFGPTGSLEMARFDHTATRLLDGRVLITGGQTSPRRQVSPTASAEIFDPSTGRFSATGSMHVERQNNTATLLQDGRVLIVGGFDHRRRAVAAAEIYDPASAKFTLTGSLNTARGWHSATLLASGKVFIEGGDDIPDCQLFMLKLYGLLGCPAGDLNAPDIPAELFDPALRSFATLGGYQPVRVGFSATLLADGRVFVTGGGVDVPPGRSTGDFMDFVYDPAHSPEFNPGGSPFIPVAHIAPYDGTVTLLHDGRVLACGGMSESYDPTGSPPNSFAALPAGMVFDPVNPSGGFRAYMTTGRDGATATLLNDGSVLVAGGYDFTQDLASAELFES